MASGGGQVEMIGNVAISAAGGGLNVFGTADGIKDERPFTDMKTSNLLPEQRAVANGKDTVDLDSVPVRKFSGFESYNVDTGMFVWARTRNRSKFHDIYSKFDDIKLWGVREHGINVPYSSMNEFTNVTIVADPNSQEDETRAFTGNLISQGIRYKNIHIDGFDKGLRAYESSRIENATVINTDQVLYLEKKGEPVPFEDVVVVDPIHTTSAPELKPAPEPIPLTTLKTVDIEPDGTTEKQPWGNEPTDSFFLSLDKNGTVDGLNVANEDILQFDGTNFSVFFDGSDVGIADNIDGLAVISATEILMSFQTAVTLAEVGTVEDGDIVKFTASALGPDTAGSFEMYLDGSQVGLTAGIDGLTGLPDGSLLISTDKKTNVPVLGQVRDEDILRFTPTTPGNTTSGSWAMYMDGGDVGLGTFAENINAVGVDAAGDLLLSTQGNFDVTTVTGADEDVFVYTPTSSTSGTYSPDLFFDGSEFGLGGNDISGLDIAGSSAPPSNNSPNAIDDTLTTDEDTATTLDVSTLLSNDTDADGNSLTITSFDTTGTLGQVTDNEDGTFSYDPNGQFEQLNDGETATDSFAYTINDGNGGTDTATVDVTITATPEPTDSFFLSLVKNETVDGLNVANEDILQFDGTNFSIFFDGSDVGIADNIDGLAVISATEILMSFQTAVILADVGTVEDGDIVKFSASVLGPDTAGSFEMYLDGSQVGLTAGIDGLTGLSDGSLLISTDKKTNVPVLGQVRDEDILRFTPNVPGDNTSGTWSMYMDGGKVGLKAYAENIDAVGVDAAGDLLLSTQGNFDVTTTAGADEDIFVYTPASSTSGTYGSDLFFDGSLFGLGGNDISGLSASIDVQ